MSYSLNTTGLSAEQIETARKANIVRFLTDNPAQNIFEITKVISVQSVETRRLVGSLETAGTIVRAVAKANGHTSDLDTFSVA